MENESKAGELRRGLGLSTSTYVVIASIVGTGILTTSGSIVKDTCSQTLMLGLWLAGGVLALCGALTVAEMAAAMPHAGGEYVFIREAYGPLPAFVYGWISFVVGFSAPTAIAAHACARYLVEAWRPADPQVAESLILPLAVAIIVTFTVVHMRGTVLSSRAQNASTVAKLVILAALALGGLAVGRGSLAHLRMDLPASGLPAGPLAVSLVFVMFSYTGWNAATYLAGEIRDAPRVLPRAMLLGCGVVTGLYVLLNVAYVYALPVAEIVRLPKQQVEAIAAVAAERLFGPWISRPLSAGIGLGLLATVSAFVLTGPRVYYAMARDGLFPSPAARLHPRTGTPNAAIAAQGACTLVLLVSGSFQNILLYAGLGLSLSSFFVVLAVFVLRVRQPDMPRPFRTPGYPVVPSLYLICTAWMIIHTCRYRPLWSLITLGSIFAGVPVYAVWRALSASRGNP